MYIGGRSHYHIRWHKIFVSVFITLCFAGLEALVLKRYEGTQNSAISRSPTLVFHSRLFRKYSKTGLISPNPKSEEEKWVQTLNLVFLFIAEKFSISSQPLALESLHNSRNLDYLIFLLKEVNLKFKVENKKWRPAGSNTPLAWRKWKKTTDM